MYKADIVIFDYAIAAPFIFPAGTDARRFTEITDATIRFAPIIYLQDYLNIIVITKKITGQKQSL